LNDFYYNHIEDALCYWDADCTESVCSFKEIGIELQVKNMIKNALWHTSLINLAGDFASTYNEERSGNSSKICTTGDYCNDGVERTSRWTGQIGLKYLSDFLASISLDGESWLSSSDGHTWTMTPLLDSFYANEVAQICDSHIVVVPDYAFGNASHDNRIKPTVYLKKEVFLTSGVGSVENPFVLGI